MRFIRCLALVSAALLLPSVPGRSAELGIGLTPAHLPNQRPADVERMFQIAGGLGSFPVILGRWDDPAVTRTVGQMVTATDRDQLRAIVQLDLFEPGGVRLAPPAPLSARRFDGATAKAYVQAVADIAAQHPSHVIAGMDVNRLLAAGTDQLAEFARAYKQAYRAAKAVSPDTKVLVGFNYEIFRTVRDKAGLQWGEVKKLVDLFRPELDAIAFSAAPSDVYDTPAAIPGDYLDGIAKLRDREDVLLFTGWPGSAGGAAAQAAFVDRLPGLTGPVQPAVLIWPILHDVPGAGRAGTLGLYTSAGEEKPAAARFRALRPGPAAGAPQPAPQAVATGEAPRRNPADTFQIAASTLAGKPPALLASDPKREINHARVSPDGTRFVFTRYNRFNAAGEALEINGYVQSEIVVCRMDGTSCEVVIPARRGVVAANAGWTPDGLALLFVTNDRPGRKAGIARLDMATRAIAIVSADTDREFADPHQVGQMMVTSTRDPMAPDISRLALFDLGSMQQRALTKPVFAQAVEMDPPLGDHDPKLSPDGRLVATMRHVAQDDWAIVVVDTATRQERTLSRPNSVDAVPEWSSDGKLLLFWTVDRADLRRSGLYTAEPDGSGRRKVMLPPGRFYTMPAFYPSAGSGPGAQIVFSSRPDPRM